MSKIFSTVQAADIEWRNGVPYSRQFKDIYFSFADGLAESRHVFIDGNNLITRWKYLSKSMVQNFSIGETGFGTGLNFLLTWSLWRKHSLSGMRLQYFSCEKYPLKKSDLRQVMEMWPELTELTEQLLARWPALTPGRHCIEFIKDRVTLILMIGDAQEMFDSLLQSGHVQEEKKLPTPKIDAWFLDGFAPSRNEDMWNVRLCATIAMLSGNNTTLATFSVARSVRESLASVGFVLEKRPGFAYKREMLCARMSGISEAVSVQKPKTAWHYPYFFDKPDKKVIIVGGGLAGAFAAYFLSIRGWHVTVMDKASSVGQGASGNPQAVTFPHFSAYDSPMSRLMLQAWHYSMKFYHDFCDDSIPHQLNGLINIANSLKNDSALLHFIEQHPQLGKFLDSESISDIAGNTIDSSGFFFRDGGWIDGAALCKKLLDFPNIECRKQQNVTDLHYLDGEWHLNGLSASKVILATGSSAHLFKQTSYLPIKGIRGQMTFLPAQGKLVQVPVCGIGHILPAYADKIAIGATYDLKHQHAFCDQKDDLKNIEKIQSMPIQFEHTGAVSHHWSGVRAVTPDYLPISGPVACEEKFLHQYHSLQKNASKYIHSEQVIYPGLYVLAGFGSRGLVTTPYCARWLAGILNHEMSILSRTMQQALSPSRFLYRLIVRGQKN